MTEGTPLCERLSMRKHKLYLFTQPHAHCVLSCRIMFWIYYAARDLFGSRWAKAFVCVAGRERITYLCRVTNVILTTWWVFDWGVPSMVEHFNWYGGYGVRILVIRIIIFWEYFHSIPKMDRQHLNKTFSTKCILTSYHLCAAETNCNYRKLCPFKWSIPEIQANWNQFQWSGC